jgi:hypothetical protein
MPPLSVWVTRARGCLQLGIWFVNSIDYTPGPYGGEFEYPAGLMAISGSFGLCPWPGRMAPPDRPKRWNSKASWTYNSKWGQEDCLM